MKLLHKIVPALTGLFEHGTSTPAPQGSRALRKKTTALAIDSASAPKPNHAGRGFPFFGMPRGIRAAVVAVIGCALALAFLLAPEGPPDAKAQGSVPRVGKTTVQTSVIISAAVHAYDKQAADAYSWEYPGDPA